MNKKFNRFDEVVFLSDYDLFAKMGDVGVVVSDDIDEHEIDVFVNGYHIAVAKKKIEKK